MRVLVCGGRDYEDRETLERVLDTIPITTLIVGDARGADALARSYGYRKQGIAQISMYGADWAKHGKMAGPIRNKQMLRCGDPELVVAFPGGKGTANMVTQARKAGVKVRQIEAIL